MTKIGTRTILIVPMLRSDELIGTLALARHRIEPFTEKEIEVVMDFAAQAAIALEITRRERELRELQMELARVNRIATMEQLSSSIAHEVIQPIATARNNARAAQNFLEMKPANLGEARKRSTLLWPQPIGPETLSTGSKITLKKRRRRWSGST